jgi:hypothetical protein
MSRVFDYGGTIVAASNPVKKLKTVKKTFMIDSGDRDTVKYVSNGNFIVYLPRVYENVVSIRLAAAEFPAGPSLAEFKSYTDVVDLGTGIPSNSLYFLIDIEGLNKTDECSLGANRSGYPDGFFAKIPTDVSLTTPTFYNDKSQQDNIAHYKPAIGKLDRLHIRTRLHIQKSSLNPGFTGNIIHWPNLGTIFPPEFSLTFEVEYLDNVFDDFSQFESRVAVRD